MRCYKELLQVFLSISIVIVPIYATGLIQALHQAGASQFAALIESDPAAASLYFSNQVKTIFAPIDGARNLSIYGNGSIQSSRRLRQRQSSAVTLQNKLYQSTSNLNSLGSMSSGSGLAMESNAKSSTFGEKPFEFVSEPENNKSQCSTVQRRDVGVYGSYDDYHICLLHYDPDFCHKQHTVTLISTLISIARETKTITIPRILTSTILSVVHETETVTKFLPSTVPFFVNETKIITVAVPTTLPPQIIYETKFVTVIVPKVSTAIFVSILEETKTVTVKLPSTILSVEQETKTVTVATPKISISTILRETTLVEDHTILSSTILYETVTDAVTKTVATPSQVDITLTDWVTKVVVSSTEINVTITDIITSVIVTPSEIYFTATDTLIRLSTVDVTVTEVLTTTLVTKSEVSVTITETVVTQSDITIKETITATQPQETRTVAVPTVFVSTLPGETRFVTILTVLTSTFVREITLDATPTLIRETTLVTVPTVITSVINHEATLIKVSTVLVPTVSRETDVVTLPPLEAPTSLVLVEETTTVPITVSPSAIPTTAYDTIATELYTVESTVTTPAPTPSLLKIASGLGNSVNVIKADIPYDGGLIHVVDDYFTLPKSLVDTANANGYTTFTGLVNSFDLTDTLDNTPGITYFIPSNEALATLGATSYYSSIQSLLLGHLIPNFVGYLPALRNGTSYKSQADTNFTVTNDGCDYYVNNARIILPNVVLGNGVAHVIDQVIHPSTPPTLKPSPTPSSGSSLHGSIQKAFAIVTVLLVIIMGLDM